MSNGASSPRITISPTSTTGRGLQFWPGCWLGLWLLNNVAVNLTTKFSLSRVDFPYPFFLSGVHMLVCSVCSHLLLSYSNIKRKEMDEHGTRFIMVFSLLFAANIAIGNLSLRLVSLKANQVMRSTVPLVVMAIDIFFFHKVYPARKKQAVIPVVLGVGMACYGEMGLSLVGFCITALCVILAALKVVVSGQALTGTWKLHPIDLLARMAPLALAQMMVISVLVGEVGQIWEKRLDLSRSFAWPLVLSSGFTAFSLNALSLVANRSTSPLTLSVAANVKQVLMVCLSCWLFGTTLTGLNILGVALVVAGSLWYSMAAASPPNKVCSPTGAAEDNLHTVKVVNNQ